MRADATLRRADVDAAAGTILGLLEAGADAGYLGESVTQLEHALQAAWWARELGGDDTAILAALLHDVGHLVGVLGPDRAAASRMDGFGVQRHESLGARWLADRGVAPAVCALVAGHVPAKRYLIATDPAYAATLSPASQATLVWQGGAMPADEVAAFAADPRCAQMVLVRRCDDRAKEPGRDVPGLDRYTDLLARHLV